MMRSFTLTLPPPLTLRKSSSTLQQAMEPSFSTAQPRLRRRLIDMAGRGSGTRKGVGGGGGGSGGGGGGGGEGSVTGAVGEKVGGSVLAPPPPPT